MQKKTIPLTGRVRFHARPAAQIADTARRFQSMIILSVNDQVIDAKNPLALMRLGTKGGCALEITVEGGDEKTATHEMENLLTSFACGTIR